ncbi:MAG: methylated-DNA--[protein]-cysteine S-methyltransferase [Acidobacteriaceae bacterium]|nr:methylated-DNA--[protein]-cysteine S-methyltransferase [Acidobacteriaceae bacterium]
MPISKIDPSRTKSPALAVPSLFPGRQWQQVLQRDASADGQFFFAVKSTKVYCRPSCTSRRPTRKDVSFFPTAAAAELAGFHACTLCQPQSAVPRPDPQAAVIAAATEYLSEHATERTKLDDLAKATGVGRLTILRGFRRVLGVSPGEFAREQRAARRKDAPRLARTPSKAIPDGIQPKPPSASASPVQPKPALSAKARRNAVIEPPPAAPQRIQRAGGAGLLIRYATAPSPLGRLLVAASDAGVCAIAFGRDDAELIADLRQRFDKAQLVSAKGNTGWLAEAIAFVQSQTTDQPLPAAFPLDLRATAFQQRLWTTLQQIPRGQTRSYSSLARELGKPTAARAVAAACAANPVAIAIPCHRAIAQDGSLSGYRWGVERKRKLLAAESKNA